MSGRRLTKWQLHEALCCHSGMGKFTRRYGDWVEIDEDWAQLEWKYWNPADIYWLCRPKEHLLQTRVPLLSDWAGRCFQKWVIQHHGHLFLWSEKPRPDFAAYFASIYVDDGRITGGQTAR